MVGVSAVWKTKLLLSIQESNPEGALGQTLAVMLAQGGCPGLRCTSHAPAKIGWHKSSSGGGRRRRDGWARKPTWSLSGSGRLFWEGRTAILGGGGQNGKGVDRLVGAGCTLVPGPHGPDLDYVASSDLNP